MERGVLPPRSKIPCHPSWSGSVCQETKLRNGCKRKFFLHCTPQRTGQGRVADEVAPDHDIIPDHDAYQPGRVGLLEHPIRRFLGFEAAHAEYGPGEHLELGCGWCALKDCFRAGERTSCQPALLHGDRP